MLSTTVVLLRCLSTITYAMVTRMMALISWFVRLFVEDMVPQGRHRPDTVQNPHRIENIVRQGRRYKRPEYRWMSPTLLMVQVRLRDLHTQTRPLRWWQHDDSTMTWISQEAHQIARWHQGDMAGRMA